MKAKFLLSGLLVFGLLTLLDSTSVLGQFGKKAKRAALKTRNKQISRFTVRTDFSKSKKYISFGGGIGATNYFGDLAPRNRRGSSSLGYTRTYTTAFYLHRVHPHITIRSALTWMRLRGDDYSVANVSSPDPDDKGRFGRNLNFRNDIFEVSGVGVFELFPTDRGFLRRSFLNPYGVIGLAFFHHNPQAKTPVTEIDGTTPKSSTWVDLQPLGTEGQYTEVPGTPAPYSLWQIGIPIGIGLRYRIADKWDLSLEMCYRFVFTDYLDDVSSKYPSDEVYKKIAEDGNNLGITLSNRSAEPFAAVDGERRADISRAWGSTWAVRDNGPSKNTETFLTSPDGQEFVRVNGTESFSSPRGNKRRDYWVNTAFHLAYILEIKQKPPKFR